MRAVVAACRSALDRLGREDVGVEAADRAERRLERAGVVEIVLVSRLWRQSVLLAPIMAEQPEALAAMLGRAVKKTTS